MSRATSRSNGPSAELLAAQITQRIVHGNPTVDTMRDAQSILRMFGKNDVVRRADIGREDASLLQLLSQAGLVVAERERRWGMSREIAWRWADWSKW